MGIKINEKLIKHNFSSRGGESIKYIVVHATGNTGYKANADAHFNYFNSGDRQSSAHYFVDDTQILRIVKDSDKSWHCGDGKGKYGVTNANSIGVEMCINKDGNFNLTYRHTVELVKHLMSTYSIGIDKVVRHHDASGKACPDIWREDNWGKWHKFKADIAPQISNKDYSPFITKLYLALFGRYPDEEGLAYWSRKLKEGTPYGELLKSMGDSEEFVKLYVEGASPSTD